MKTLIILLLIGSQAYAKKTDQNNLLWSINTHDHAVVDAIKLKTKTYIDKGRVQVVKADAVTIHNLPKNLKQHIEPIALSEIPRAYSNNLNSLHYKVRNEISKLYKKNQKVDPKIEKLIAGITEKSFYNKVKWITDHGKRSNQDATKAFIAEFNRLGLETTYDYNIEALKKGTTEPEKFIIIEGHMDTVRGTVGADDNASGSAGVFEIARVLQNYNSKYSILFVLTEDEEKGLLGAKYLVKKLKKQNRLKDLKFVINMDMIAYNQNGVLDLETEPKFKGVAEWMSDLTYLYTSLSPNLVLNAWGSDHVPFIKANIDTVLTIEHWNTHTPCRHKKCDTIDTINANYGAEVVRLNTAATILKAGVEL